MDTVTIEQTSKPLKRQIIISVLTLAVGILTVIIGASAESIPVIVAGVIVTLGGLIWLAVTKARVWWNHK